MKQSHKEPEIFGLIALEVLTSIESYDSDHVPLLVRNGVPKRFKESSVSWLSKLFACSTQNAFVEKRLAAESAEFLCVWNLGRIHDLRA